MESHPDEKKVLEGLSDGSWYEASLLSGKTGLNADKILRTVSWLKTKGLVDVQENVKTIISMGPEGVEYAKKGLPERRLIDSIMDGVSIGDLRKKSDEKTFGIGFGWLRRKDLIKVKDGVVTVKGSSETGDEKLLKTISSKTRVVFEDLSPDEKKAAELLKSRKDVVVFSEEKLIRFKITDAGVAASKNLTPDDSVSQLTPELISSGDWKNKRFRPYDVSVYVKPAYPAKKHPLKSEIDSIRGIFLGMGFTEIKGGFVESSFWNFDALFTAQDHPVRDMHDTFYLKNPKEIEIPGFDGLWKRVCETHENGWTTGSTGWQYKWDKKKSRNTVLRTHTTAVTARHLSTLSDKDLPVKVFSIGKTFRNEALDYKHLPEFYQIEGIVAERNASFRHLLGILREFYERMGFKVRFRPGYFPYTEMSVEPEVFFEDRGEWVELGGAGIFRPEVVKPLLGFDCPVLAWGLGLDRVVALKMGLNDIRDLYVSDLDWLRKAEKA